MEPATASCSGAARILLFRLTKGQVLLIEALDGAGNVPNATTQAYVEAR